MNDIDDKIRAFVKQNLRRPGEYEVLVAGQRVLAALTSQKPEPLNTLEQLVLTATQMLENPYGRKIHDQVTELSGRKVLLARVYMTIDRLEERGLLKTWLSDPMPERGGRRCRFVALTNRGKHALSAALSERELQHSGLGMETS